MTNVNLKEKILSDIRDEMERSCTEWHCINLELEEGRITFLSSLGYMGGSGNFFNPSCEAEYNALLEACAQDYEAQKGDGFDIERGACQDFENDWLSEYDALRGFSITFNVDKEGAVYIEQSFDGCLYCGAGFEQMDKGASIQDTVTAGEGM